MRKSIKILREPLTISSQIIKSIHDLNLWFMLAAECCHFIQHQSSVTCRMINWRNSENTKKIKICKHKAAKTWIYSPQFPSRLLWEPHDVLFSSNLCANKRHIVWCRYFKKNLMFRCIINQTMSNYIFKCASWWWTLSDKVFCGGWGRWNMTNQFMNNVLTTTQTCRCHGWSLQWPL